jgi:putative two-component system response regulator
MTIDDLRIVIVDDLPANVRLLERILAGAGYMNVFSTTDPLRALELVEDLNPDLLLLDLHMPQLDGFGVLEEMGRRFPHSQTFLPVLVLTADVAVESRQRALLLGAKDFITKPFDKTEVILRVKNLLETRSLHLEISAHSELLEQQVQERTNELWTAVTRLEFAERELKLSRAETIEKLSLAAEFRDDDTAKHIQRMSRYCELLAGAIGYDDDDREQLQVASVMHDVGKIGIPDRILLKPGPLSPDERRTMEMHAEIGYQILSGSDSELLGRAALIAWTHHERFDGNGYPRGIAGEEIPMDGRIAAIADVFDALTTDRVYRKAFDPAEAVRIMREGRATQFDARLLDCFFEMQDEALRIKKAYDEKGHGLMRAAAS